MTTLNERLMNDMKEAMRNKETLRKGVITLIRAGLLRAAKDKQDALTDTEQTAIVQRELKQAKDSLTEAIKAGREDIVAQSKEKMVIIESYLPTMLTAEEILDVLVKKGATKDMPIGRLIGLVMKDYKGKVDGSLVREVAESFIKE